MVVIDALDECDNEQDIRELLRIIFQAKRIKKCPLRFFITSRPEVPITYSFYKITDAYFYDFALHEVDDPTIRHDITVYLTSELRNIYCKYSGDSSDWPSPEKVCHLAERAGKFFIYAATACRFIDGGRSALFQERLTEILKDDSDGSEPIDKMYLQILEYIACEYTREKDRKIYFEKFQRIIGSVILLLNPLAVSSLSKLLSYSNQATSSATTESVKLMLSPLSSILNIPKHEEAPISLFHLSFRDFLLSKERCKNKDLFVSEAKTHRSLVQCCLEAMLTTLRQDVCQLSKPGVLASEVEQDTIRKSLPAHIQYACQYWTTHLERIKDDQRNLIELRDNGPVHIFFRSHFLYWLEALSLMGKVSSCVSMIAQLENLTVRYYYLCYTTMLMIFY